MEGEGGKRLKGSLAGAKEAGRQPKKTSSQNKRNRSPKRAGVSSRKESKVKSSSIPDSEKFWLKGMVITAHPRIEGAKRRETG